MTLALVTGASSGIGAAVARRLAARGDKLVLGGRDRDRLAALAIELGGPDRAAVLAGDVADRAALTAALRALPPLDALVLAAGTCERARLDADDGDAVWFRVLDVNLHAVYAAIRAAAPRMPSGGRIVAVASGLGKLGRAGYAAYAASKHAVLGLVKCAARELAPRGITVNAVCPGWVDTPMARADLERSARETGRGVAAVTADVHAAIPIGRMVAADEVAALIELLVSPTAAAITGEAYNISGGEFCA